MIAVMFEVLPKAQHKETYLAIAAELLESLEHIEGFVSVERFASLSNPEKLLSLSFWENEDAVQRWRTQADHQDAQREGKNVLFQHYRIRVASIQREYAHGALPDPVKGDR